MCLRQLMSAMVISHLELEFSPKGSEANAPDPFSADTKIIANRFVRLSVENSLDDGHIPRGDPLVGIQCRQDLILDLKRFFNPFRHLTPPIPFSWQFS
jgi:hypothetical protein